MLDLLKRFFGRRSGTKTISYEEAEKLARHKDPKVRRVIATNPLPLGEIDLLLARDEDNTVRTSLAEKIAKLAPGLNAEEQNQVRRMTYEALEILARDQVVRVRQILAETLRDVANAPPEVIRRLARDAELVVAGPILEYSPVLTDRDLLEIIESGAVRGALAAVSRRPGVGPLVADAIVASDDRRAVASLLGNASAQIREETLDRILDRAPDVEEWHKPLIERPLLPARAARRLAQFVAVNLVEILIQRRDLDQQTAETVRDVVMQRLREGDFGDAKSGNIRRLAAQFESRNSTVEKPRDRARRLFEEGKLNAAAVAEALGAEATAGQATAKEATAKEATAKEATAEEKREFVMSALALLSGLRPGIVKKMVATNSAKGLVSLAWKAGMPVSIADELQKKLIHVGPKDMLSSLGSDEFPLSEEDMRWQLEFFGDM